LSHFRRLKATKDTGRLESKSQNCQWKYWWKELRLPEEEDWSHKGKQVELAGGEIVDAEGEIVDTKG